VSAPSLNMKIVFIGTVEFSLQMLTTLIMCDVEIVGVITDKDRGINSDYADLVPTCKKNNIPCFLTNDVNTLDTIEWIDKKKVDFIFCLGWSRLIKSKLLQLPSLGIVGFHPTELPKNRGRHPLIWALVLGLKKTASTFFFMNACADSGDIISQQQIIIDDDDDAQSLYKKMIDTAKGQLLTMVPLLHSRKYQPIPQDHLKANIWRKRDSDDGKIDWRMGAKQIHNLVRGLTHPYVGAYFMLDNNEYRVWKTQLVDCQGFDNIESGKIIDIDNHGYLLIKCAESCLRLVDVNPALPSMVSGDYL